MGFRRRAIAIAAALLLLAPFARAQLDLTTLSIEELANLAVTSVSRKPEKRVHAAAAVYVITQEDIRRSGVKSLPEALRLAPGVHVAHINSNQWAVSVRGFTSRLSRSVLVLIDGRSVYNPLFAGTYWEVQDTLLDDVDRIEVIRGPGGTLWGANAFNGVINIITKNSKETQGGLVKTGGGTEERAFGGVRYGGKAGASGHYRFYGKYFDRDASFHANGNNFDAWHNGQAGFRSDWNASSRDNITVQGDVYRGRAGQRTPADAFSNLFGTNVLSRWSRTLSETSGFTLQAYYDHTDRHDPTFAELRDTGDLDFQHHFAMPGRQSLTWGLGYRNTSDSTEGVGFTFFTPEDRMLQTVSAFVQDEIALVPDRLELTFGTKLENNEYSGLEWQPSVRLSGVPGDRQTIWSAVSHSVRTPSRVERDLTFGGLVNGEDFDSEVVTAYEAGYRIEPRDWALIDIAGFYNDYEKLLSLEPGPPFIFKNKFKGSTHGGEFATDLQVHPSCRLRATYSLLYMNLRTESDSQDTTTEANTEGSSPRHQASFFALFDLPHQTEINPVVRYVSKLRSQNTPDYMELDLRVAWRPTKMLELSLVGQNLLHDHHPEFTQVSEMQRGMYGKVTWHW